MKKGRISMAYILLFAALVFAGAAVFWQKNQETNETPIPVTREEFENFRKFVIDKFAVFEKTPSPIAPISNDSRIPDLALKFEKLEQKVDQLDKALKANHDEYRNNLFHQNSLRARGSEIVKVQVTNADPILVTTVSEIEKLQTKTPIKGLPKNRAGVKGSRKESNANP